MSCTAARANPWLRPDDRQLRDDLETVAASGLVDGPITTWPIPAGALEGLRDRARVESQPEAVRLAALRLIDRLAPPAGGLRAVGSLGLASEPTLIRDFGLTPRNQLDTAAGIEAERGAFALSLRGGLQSRLDGSQGRPSADGTAFVAHGGGWLGYAGWVDQWYGAGRISSLILSTNARPFPKVGLMRDRSSAFETPWLSWLGPWQLNAFIGWLDDGERIDDNTAYGAFRLSFVPLPGFEVALTRTAEFCGDNHPCKPLRAAFDLGNTQDKRNISNDQASIELSWGHAFGDWRIAPYLQLMNEDTGPLTHSYTSYLAGTELAGALGTAGARWRVVAELADTRATLDAFGFGTRAVGTAYNNTDYVDGFRYRGRSTGFSLDSDSTLASLLVVLSDRRARSLRAVWHHAEISSGALARQQAAGSPLRNVVSAQPVTLDQFELGAEVPVGDWRFDLVARHQTRRPFPASGGQQNVSLTIRYGF